MASEVAVPAKFLATVAAVVRLDVRVRQQMCLEVGSLVEGASTLRTLVRRVLHV